MGISLKTTVNLFPNNPGKNAKSTDQLIAVNEVLPEDISRLGVRNGPKVYRAANTTRCLTPYPKHYRCLTLVVLIATFYIKSLRKMGISLKEVVNQSLVPGQLKTRRISLIGTLTEMFLVLLFRACSLRIVRASKPVRVTKP